jgi:hypothetical protein
MTRTQMWLGVRHLFHPRASGDDRSRPHHLPSPPEDEINYSGLRPEAPHWLTTFWSLKRLTKIVDMSGALTLFMDMSYCSPHCKQIKRVGLLLKSRKEGRGPKRLRSGAGGVS